MDKSFKIEADGEFKFSFFIEKAIAGGTDEKMTIKGVASTTNVDHDKERMSESSLKAMAEIINQKSVPLRVEHQKDDNAVIGNVNKAWVDERNQLWIEADLDKSHPGASMLFKALKTGAKLGLSVAGIVKHAVREFSEAAGRMVKTFYDVQLQEVSVTSRPANYDSWLVQKSIIKDGENGEQFVESPFYKEFLFENQSLDYMQSFAKSIPDKSWKRSEINKNNENNMSEIKKDSTKEDETKEKAVKETDTKEKAMDDETKEKKEDDTEEKSFKSMVTKSLEGILSLVSKLKKAEGKEADDGQDDKTTIMEEKAETKEDETKEKAEDKEETASTKDYHIKSMQNVLNKIDSLSKAMDETKEDDKKEEKAMDDKDDETTEKSQKTHELDAFVASVEAFVDATKEKFEKGGKRTLGLTEMIVNAIRTDADIQKEIRDMMKEPGFKKSMQFGFPMMRTKEGKAYRLSGELMSEEVKKSQDDLKGKGFKEVYNTKFSSSASREE